MAEAFASSDRRQRASDEEDELVIRELGLAFVRENIDARGFDLGFGRAQVELRGGAGVVGRLVEGMGRLDRGQCLTGQRNLFLRLLHGEMLDGDLGDEGDLRAALVLLGGKKFLQRLRVQAADTAEEVEFVGRRSDARIPLAGGAGRCAGAPVTGIARDSGHSFGSRDAVLRAAALHAENREAQVAVVFERQFNEAPRARVEHK